MITLHPKNLRWMGVEEGAYDLCAHGDVEFEIDGESVIQPIIEDHYTVSAAALYLLRTLSQPHPFANETKFGQPLFPHCGHSMYATESKDDVFIMGCPHGADVSVTHASGEVVIAIGDGRSYRVSFPDWQVAVVQFSDAVQYFYEASGPKDLDIYDEYERTGYERFRAEWARRRAQAS